MEKMAWDGPKWGREDFFPTNPGLANILGRTDLHFENSSSAGAGGGVWKSGDLEIWEFGDLETWKFRNLGSNT